MCMTPDAHTIQEIMLYVGDGHTLYIHEWGNSKAKDTIVFLHGGPGGNCSDKSKQYFNPDKQRVIFFDQRGSGKSKPYGSLENNTTDHLIADIVKIAEHYQLKKLTLVGGSWGACLALAFAIKHPSMVKAMVLNGIFTASNPELAWTNEGMFRIFYPDVWEHYLEATPEAHRGNPTEFHVKNILSDDDEACKQSAYTMDQLTGSIVKLDDRTTPANYEEYDPTSTRIETHFTSQGCFLPDNFILSNAHKLSMPVWIIQGRYDMVCPPKTAHTLAQKLPMGEIIWTTSGHVMERESWNVIRTLLANTTV